MSDVAEIAVENTLPKDAEWSIEKLLEAAAKYQKKYEPFGWRPFEVEVIRDVPGNKNILRLDMSQKKTAILDFTKYKHWQDFHQIIKDALDFPDYYGRNWDALLDSLWGECVVDKIEIIGISTLPKELECEVHMMLEVLNDYVNDRAELDEHFEFEVIS